MTKFTEGRHPGEAIMSEGNGAISRANVTIAESQTILACGLISRLAVATSVVTTPSAAAGNTGNATIAMTAPETTTKVKDGRYKGIAVTATTVRWEDPDGNEIGTSTHGSAFAKGGIKLTITAGGNANVAGDEFYVDVAADADDFQWAAFNPDGTDGSETPDGISIYPVTTGSGETVQTTALVRLCELNGNCISWPVGITDAQRADAIQALQSTNIIVRY